MTPLHSPIAASNISTLIGGDPDVPSSRNLVLCFDGTTNKFGADRLTNVVRIFELLQKDSPRQICYYQPGIGTYDAKVPLQEQTPSLASKLSMLMDAALANGIRKHILGGYRFLMAHYRLGDKIYMFGFSRGAYTVRALCGMLEKIGLLSFGNDEQVTFAWEMYKRKGNEALAAKFREVFCQDVQVYFLGLWETVKSTRQEFSDPQTDSFVSHVYHALALDERRINFPPHFYCEPTRQQNDDRLPTQIFERWFVGDHSDVGGRFPFHDLDKDALANPPFRWIVWGAARAASNIKRPLLFNLRAFHKYFNILVYTKNDPTVSSLRKSITVDYFRHYSPEFDSKNTVAESDGGRPPAEIQSTKLKVNDVFKAPSLWVLMQLLRGRGAHGNARRIDGDSILHASVQGRIYTDQEYGGKRRAMLEELAARADEVVAPAHDLRPHSVATNDSPSGRFGPSFSLHVEPPSPTSATSRESPVPISPLLSPEDAYRIPIISRPLPTNQMERPMGAAANARVVQT